MKFTVVVEEVSKTVAVSKGEPSRSYRYLRTQDHLTFLARKKTWAASNVKLHQLRRLTFYDRQISTDRIDEYKVRNFASNYSFIKWNIDNFIDKSFDWFFFTPQAPTARYRTLTDSPTRRCSTATARVTHIHGISCGRLEKIPFR